MVNKMIDTKYALRDKKSGKILSLNIDANDEMDLAGNYTIEKEHYLDTWGEYGQWETNDIRNVLFLKTFRASNSSAELPSLSVPVENVEIVAIHSFMEARIITTENIPQSLFDFFEDIEEIIRFSTVRGDFVYEDYLYEGEIAQYRKYPDELKMDTTKLFYAWEYLKHLGRVNVPEVNKNIFINSCEKMLKELGK